MKTHPYPRFEWTPCSEPPDRWRRVLIWHRARPWCRFFRATVGWWNRTEWRRDDSDIRQGAIYQPVLWKDIEPPSNPKLQPTPFG